MVKSIKHITTLSETTTPTRWTIKSQMDIRPTRLTPHVHMFGWALEHGHAHSSLNQHHIGAPTSKITQINTISNPVIYHYFRKQPNTGPSWPAPPHTGRISRSTQNTPPSPTFSSYIDTNPCGESTTPASSRTTPPPLPHVWTLHHQRPHGRYLPLGVGPPTRPAEHLSRIAPIPIGATQRRPVGSHRCGLL
jgi:hypothetical protein